MHIAITGNIGSGKTTLTQMLARHYGYKPVYESADNNPYLSSFYEDMRRWSFNLQIHFLHTRIRQLLEVRHEYSNIIQDRTIYEDAYVFAPNLHAMGLLNTRDLENYIKIFELIDSFIQPPDLMIYLKGDVPQLIRQIQRRGREYDNAIRLDYLTSLNNRYDSWIEEYNKSKKLIINIEEVNFADVPEDLGYVINQIDSEFNSLFSSEQ